MVESSTEGKSVSPTGSCPSVNNRVMLLTVRPRSSSSTLRYGDALVFRRVRATLCAVVGCVPSGDTGDDCDKSPALCESVRMKRENIAASHSAQYRPGVLFSPTATSTSREPRPPPRNFVAATPTICAPWDRQQLAALLATPICLPRRNVVCEVSGGSRNKLVAALCLAMKRRLKLRASHCIL